MALVEDVSKRTRTARHSFDAATGQRQAELSLADLHYWDGSAWQPINESLIVDTSIPGFTQRANGMRHAVWMGDDGSRRWQPRRDVATEFVEFGAPQFWTGSAWSGLNLSAPTRPQPNVMLWDRPNFALQLATTWRRVKLDLTLKNSAAAKQIRWPVSLTGLSFSFATGQLTSISDGSIVGHVNSVVGTDSSGGPGTPPTTVPIVSSFSGGFLQFTADLTGLVFPINIDPTLTVQSNVDATETDNEIVSTATTTNNGAVATINFGDFAAGNTRNILLRFDVSSIPAGSTVSDANLTFNSISANGVTFSVAWYILLVTWTEAGSTWNTRDGAVAWSTAGAAGSGTDHAVSSTVSSSLPNLGGSLNLTGFGPDVQTWVNGTTNNGWVAIPSTAPAGMDHTYSSSEAVTAANRPKLIVNYVTNSIPPGLGPVMHMTDLATMDTALMV